MFKTDYDLDDEPHLKDVASGEPDFYSHVVCKIGVKLGVWNKIGNAPIAEHSEIWFRQSDDSGNTLITLSKKWRIWKVGGEMKFVGKLPEECKKFEIGLIVNPYNLVERIEHGRFTFVYPNFE